jgi:hypothetical protein
MRTKPFLTLLLATTAAAGAAQPASRLIATSFRAEQGEPQLVHLDSTYYTYSGERGGDLTSVDPLFDRSYHWQRTNGSLSFTDGHVRFYNGLDQVVVDTSLQFPLAPWAFSFVRWTYDEQGRPATEVWFSGSVSVFFRERTYTLSGKPATLFVSQPYEGAWANTTTTFTYNDVDSLTDRVVQSDFLSYAFRWRYSPEGWLVRYEEDTPSDPRFVDHYYFPNGKPMARRDSAGAQPWMIDSTFNDWNSTYDTVTVDDYNGQFGFEQPNGRARLAYDSFGRRIERVAYEAIAGTWVPLSRHATTYTAFGALSVDSFFTWNGAAFEHAMNETYSYAPDGQLLERVVTMDVDGTMVPVSRGTWTYNSYGQLTRATNEDTLGGGWRILGDQRYYYEEYVVGVSEDPSSFELVLYPNPATDRVCCTVPAGMAATVRFEWYDTTGKPIPIRSQGNGREYTVFVEGLASGVYIVHATDGERRMVGRMMVQ